MGKKAAIFSCIGLGDGLISLMVSNNLHLNGFDTITFHEKKLMGLQNWFPHLKIEDIPKIDQIPKILDSYDKIFISYNSSHPFIQKLIKEGKELYPEKVIVLNPSFSKNCGSQPYAKDACFRRDISMVDNIEFFCKNFFS